MPLRFTKMHGIGNDYVYVNVFDQPEPRDPAALARAISDRHRGVGSDGLVLIGPSERANARMRMFNADGSEGEMCGNAIRCVAKYLYERQLVEADRITVETGRGVLPLDLERDGRTVRRVRVEMGTPILEAERIPTTLPGRPPLDTPIEIDGETLRVTCVSMGNPHAVAFVENVDAVPLERIGPRVEHHPSFPKRINFHVVERVGPDEVRMRTWERGSGITMACGTGACAVCVAGALTGRTERRVLAHLPGGDLELEWPADDQPVLMTGPAEEVFSGEWPEGES